jgi:hypothetical protein
MFECVYCEGVADFKWLDGGWYVCSECIKDGETDAKAESESMQSIDEIVSLAQRLVQLTGGKVND